MQRFNHFRQIIPAAAIIVLAFAPPVHAQEDTPSLPRAADAMEPAAAAMFKGMRRCAMCHRQSEAPDPEVTREFCLLNEVIVFRRDDKHARAYQLLQEDLGQRMGKKLNIDVSHAKECLSCHSGWLSRQGFEKPPSIESGVTCESCHGPSELWDGPHSEPDWRKKTSAEKKDLGMDDVRDPLRRAQICYSCHIGNSDQGKVVTHDMYAAGHPLLPSIEIETFVAAMPAHSRKLQEKGNFEFRGEFIVASRLGDAAGQPLDGLPRTKGVLVGAIMALREALDLFAKQSVTDNAPEFALFDCQACHHELRLPAWRQARSSRGRFPGRPRLPDWPAVLAKIAIAQVESDPKVFNVKLEELAQAFDARPFGGSDNVQKLLKGNGHQDDGLIAWLDKRAQALSARSFNQKEASSALEALYALGSTEVHDFHSARQIAWAIRAIEAETRAAYPVFPDRVANLPLEDRRSREEKDIKIWTDWRDKKAADIKAAEILGKLNEPLRLTLPAGQKDRVIDNLKPFLESTADYDPESFQKFLRETASRSGRAAAGSR